MLKRFPKHIVGVGGIVENDRGEILLVKHRDHKAWAFPGGQVDNGENLTDALIREIKEESGINVHVVKLIAVTSNTAGYEGTNGYEDIPTKVMLDFVCKFIDGKLSSSDETSESKWVRKEEVMDYMSSPAYRHRFQAYLDFDGTIAYLEYVTRPEFCLKLKRDI